MNPWRKRRRQKLRRQNEGFYGTQSMVRLSDLGIEVSFGPLSKYVLGITGPLTAEQDRDLTAYHERFRIPILLQRSDETDAEYIQRVYGIDFTKPMPRIAHDPSEFFGPEEK